MFLSKFGVNNFKIRHLQKFRPSGLCFTALNKNLNALNLELCQNAENFKNISQTKYFRTSTLNRSRKGSERSFEGSPRKGQNTRNTKSKETNNSKFHKNAVPFKEDLTGNKNCMQEKQRDENICNKKEINNSSKAQKIGSPCDEPTAEEYNSTEEQSKVWKPKRDSPHQENPCQGVDTSKPPSKLKNNTLKTKIKVDKFENAKTENSTKTEDPCKLPQSKKKQCPPLESTPPESEPNENAPKMNALVLDFELREVSLKQVAAPRYIKKDEVMVQVGYAGANLADLAVMEGRIKSCQEKLIPGREMSGVICGVGDLVKHIKAGDQVVVAPCMPNSLCQFCSDQKNTCCVKEPSGKLLGVDRDGGWAEYCIAPMNTVYKVPPCTMKQAALLPVVAQVMCALHSLQIRPNQEVVIIGAGLPGLLFAIILRHNNHEKVSICEDHPVRVQMIEDLKLCYPVINVNQLCGNKPDVVISCGAGTSVMQRALFTLNSHGLFVIFGATGGNGSKPEIKLLPGDVSSKRMTIRGMEGTPANASNVPPAVITQYLDPEKLGVEVTAMQDFKDGLTKLSAGDVNHVLFEVHTDF